MARPTSERFEFNLLSIPVTELKQTTFSTDAPSESPKVEVNRRGAVAQFILNRPKTLNAFDDDMRRVLADEIPRIARNPDVYIVALTSASPKAFSAGGDVRRLVTEAKTDIETVKGYFRAEYALDWLLDCFSKPTISLIDGLCMGSGAGLTCTNTHRVAGEAYKWAMPETAIGLFPDVGVAHVLGRMPWPIGLYLGLTGDSLGRADAQWLKLTTHCIPATRFAHILDQLADAEPVDPLLDGLHEPQSSGPLQSRAAMIEEHFSGESLAEIIASLEKSGSPSREFAEKALAVIKARSPISLAITDRHIRTARTLDLRQTLIQDYRLAVRCLEGHDFYEGVRAALIDKDARPQWSPARLSYVTEAMVEAYFAPVPSGDLVLQSRPEMQAARV
ncbi:MAG: enoyl-CoA hydratase/isomerase family protein [Hyphomicrobium sp.]